MITLRGKLKKENDIANSKNRDYNKRASIRDKLLVKEVFDIATFLQQFKQFLTFVKFCFVLLLLSGARNGTDASSYLSSYI